MALRSPSAPCLGRVHVLPVFDISYSPTWGHPALISFANHGTRLFLTPPLSSLALVTRFLFRHSSAAALAVRRRVRATNPRVVGSISSMPSRVDPSIIWPRAFFTPVLLVCSLPLLCLRFAPCRSQRRESMLLSIHFCNLSSTGSSFHNYFEPRGYRLDRVGTS